MNMDALIIKWQGGKARMWRYKASDKILAIRVEFEGHKGNLHIFCADVSCFRGPTGWHNAYFEYERVNSDRIILRDVKAGFEAHAGSLSVQENCEPF